MPRNRVQLQKAMSADTFTSEHRAGGQWKAALLVWRSPNGFGRHACGKLASHRCDPKWGRIKRSICLIIAIQETSALTIRNFSVLSKVLLDPCLLHIARWRRVRPSARASRARVR